MFRKLLVASLFLFYATTSVHAQSAQPTASGYDFNKDPWGYKITQSEFTQYRKAVENCDTPSLECLVRNTTRFIAMEWSQDIVGSNKINNLDCTLPENADFCTTSSAKSGGLTASVFTLVGSMMAKPPAHTATYVADVLNTAGVATPAYAQGVGFASLDPILGLWKVFRNVAYFFFIVAFIILGFMIMFQQRLGGKAAVTAQQAIPSVIISLLLVTFSYAIAGFAVDLMYLFMFLIVGLFQGIQATFSAGVVKDPVSFTFLDLIGFLFSSSWSWQSNGLNTDIVSSLINAAGVQSNALTTVVSMIGGLTLTLVITLAVLIGAFRLLFELLKSYIIIILSVVTAPLVLMMGALPGKDVFWPWLKGIIGNLMAFPTVLLLLIIYIEFTTGTIAEATGSSVQGGFMPPFLFGSGSGNVNMIGPILGLALILAMPEVVKEVKKIAGASDTGGFLGTVFAGASKRFGEAEVALPAAMAGAYGVPGGLRGVQKAWTAGGDRTPISLARAFRSGWKDESTGRTYGGFGGPSGWGSKGWRQGSSIRKTIDRIRENRLFEAEDIEKTLSRLAEGKSSSGKETKSTSLPAGEPAPSSGKH